MNSNMENGADLGGDAENGTAPGATRTLRLDVPPSPWFAFFFHVRATLPWERAFPTAGHGAQAGAPRAWAEGPLTLKAGRLSADHSYRTANTYTEVRDRIIARNVRKCLVVPGGAPLELNAGNPGRSPFTVRAFEAVAVSGDGAGCQAVLVMHVRASTSDLRDLSAHFPKRWHTEQLNAAAKSLLVTSAGLPQDCLTFLSATGGENPLGGWLRTMVCAPMGGPRPWNDAERDAAQLARLSWQWATMSPAADSLNYLELRDAEDRVRSVGHASFVRVSARTSAYLLGQEPVGAVITLAEVLSLHLDAHLLVELNRIRVRQLSMKLAGLGRKLGDATSNHTLRDTGGPHDGAPTSTEERFDSLISEAIELDNEVALLLSIDWWSEAAGNSRTDVILRWVKEHLMLAEAIDSLTDQARVVRESIQTLLERREHQMEANRAASERRLEFIIGMLGVIGVPLTAAWDAWLAWGGDGTTGRAVGCAAFLLVFFASVSGAWLWVRRKYRTK